MKELLQKLTTFAPALIAQMKGDPVALEQFTKGYQATLAQLEEKKLREQQMTMQGEDRQLAMADRERMITRQADMDRIAAEERDYRKSQDALKALSEFVPAQETMGGAESMSQSILSGVPPTVRERVAGVADQQLRDQPRMITGRQRKQVEEYLDRWAKSDRAAEFSASEIGPDMIEIALPEHLSKYLGKPSASLAELQQFAQLPVGKPQGKTRTPPAAGSMEEFSDPNITPGRKAQILADRKAYMQSDDRAPRVTVNTGGVDSKGMARFNSIASAYDRSPLIKAADRTLILDDAAKKIRTDPKNAAAQMALAYGYIQALDTYQSAVREGELGNLGTLGTVWQQLGVSANKLVTTGAFMPPEVALQIANSADQMVQVIEKGRNQKMAEFASRAKVNRVEDMWNEFVAGMPTRAQAGGGTAPMQKAIPGIRGGVAESTDGGKTWKRVK